MFKYIKLIRANCRVIRTSFQCLIRVDMTKVSPMRCRRFLNIATRILHLPNRFNHIKFSNDQLFLKQSTAFFLK